VFISILLVVLFCFKIWVSYSEEITWVSSFWLWNWKENVCSDVHWW